MSRGPRIFCIPAASAPVVAVLRRGPSQWYHVGRWNLDNDTYEAGAWFKGRLFPQKCDLSPDGRWLVYSALKMTAQWPAGTIYEAISRLPWLHALAAWEAGTTYTRGIHFDEEAGVSDVGRPDVGDADPCLKRYGIRLNRGGSFAVERRRGWAETEDTPAKAPHDVWDTRRDVRMRKPDPAGRAVLEVEVSYAAFRDMPDWREPACYGLTRGNELEILEDVQWADWDEAGRLLVATVDGRLQAREWRDGRYATMGFEYDLSELRPEPLPAPAWAQEW